MKERRIWVLGAGNMGAAIMRGLIAAKHVKPESLCASDVSNDRLSHLKDELHIVTTSSNHELVKSADVVVLAVKPQTVASVLGEIGDTWQKDTLVLSILAGVSTATLEAKLPAAVRVIRAMPNTAAVVLESATAVTRGTRATEADIATERQRARVRTSRHRGHGGWRGARRDAPSNGAGACCANIRWYSSNAASVGGTSSCFEGPRNQSSWDDHSRIDGTGSGGRQTRVCESGRARCGTCWGIGSRSALR